MNLTGKKLLIRNEEEGRKAQYLLFLFGYCWWSMMETRNWRYNHIEEAYICQVDFRNGNNKLLRYEENLRSYELQDKEEVTLDQLIKQIAR